MSSAPDVVYIPFIDKNTGRTKQRAEPDANKAMDSLDEVIMNQMAKKADGWVCMTCGFLSKKKSNCASHVESKHVLSEGFSCPYCALFCPNRKSLRNHTDRHHKDK
eukprot:GFUD01003788.1.p1 GENE.GFUD01003788.1~~GFUD01003788.1.p1  ORF type:complete len:106 (+),score=10.87 GFUD01003788.1:71-388(+)